MQDTYSNRISNDSRGGLAPHSILPVKLLKNPDTCPHCGSQHIILGAGKKPGEESRRCGGCRHFLGYSPLAHRGVKYTLKLFCCKHYSPLARLKKARKRKELTECLQILENQGIQGELALFTISLADDKGGEG